MSQATRLYTPQLLALAVELADYPYDLEADLIGEARSPTCGSRIELSLTVVDDAIGDVGIRCQACAVGQAAAAIFASGAPGANATAINAALDQISAWTQGGALPRWAGFEALAAAQDHPGRHGAVLLPWKAARAALCSRAPAR